MIEKNKSLLFSVLGHVYKHILPDSCMYAWVVLSSGWQKNLQGEYSWVQSSVKKSVILCVVLNSSLAFHWLCWDHTLYRSIQIIICADILTNYFIHENGHSAWFSFCVLAQYKESSLEHFTVKLILCYAAFNCTLYSAAVARLQLFTGKCKTIRQEEAMEQC